MLQYSFHVYNNLYDRDLYKGGFFIKILLKRGATFTDNLNLLESKQTLYGPLNFLLMTFCCTKNNGGVTTLHKSLKLFIPTAEMPTDDDQRPTWQIEHKLLRHLVAVKGLLQEHLSLDCLSVSHHHLLCQGKIIHCYFCILYKTCFDIK